MAKQVGILPLEGRIENLTFYRTANGYSVQKVKEFLKKPLQPVRHFKEPEKIWQNLHAQLAHLNCCVWH